MILIRISIESIMILMTNHLQIFQMKPKILFRNYFLKIKSIEYFRGFKWKNEMN